MKITITTDQKCEKCGRYHSRTFDNKLEATVWIEEGCDIYEYRRHQFCRECLEACKERLNEAVDEALAEFVTPDPTVVVPG